MQDGRLEEGRCGQTFDQLSEVSTGHLLGHLAEAGQVVVEVAPGGFPQHNEVRFLEGLATGRVEGLPTVQDLQDLLVRHTGQSLHFLLVVSQGPGGEQLDH